GLGAANLQQFQSTFSQNGGTLHIHGAPVVWNSPTNGTLAYVWGENDYLRTYQYNGNTFNTPSFKTGTAIAPQIGNGMPGANIAVSSNGNQSGTGVVWGYAVYDGNANQATRPGILRAYNADNATSELWDSKQAAGDDCGYLAKGTHPIVANGKVIIASFGTASLTNSGQVCIYGLKSNPGLPAGTVPNYPNGFAGATQFVYNGSAYASGTGIRLTDSRANEAGSVFFLQKLDVTKFHANFSFQSTSSTNT